MDIRKKSQRQEKRVAKEISGRVTPASGALWGAKGDVKSELFLVECKITEKPAYPLTIKTWTKIQKEALRENFRIPVMCIELLDGRDKMAVVCFNDLTVSDTFSDIISRLETQTVDKKQFMIHNQPVKVDWSSCNQKLIVFNWSDFLECVGEV